MLRIRADARGVRSPSSRGVEQQHQPRIEIDGNRPSNTQRRAAGTKITNMIELGPL